jgi:hypothetical protein
MSFFCNGKSWLPRLGQLGGRYGAYNLYYGLPCTEAALVLSQLIALLERDGCHVAPPPVALLEDPDDAAQGFTMIFGFRHVRAWKKYKDPSIHARAQLIRRLAGLPWRRIRPLRRFRREFRTIVVPRRAITHASLAHCLWRWYKQHLEAARACGSSDCSCWRRPSEPVFNVKNYAMEEWPSIRDPHFVLPTTYY